MNDRIIKIGLESGMLNYVDNETPRHYFLCGNADEQDLEKFAELIIKESITEMEKHDYHAAWLGEKLKEHFGVEE